MPYTLVTRAACGADAVAKLFRPRTKAAQTAQEPAIVLPVVPPRKPAMAPEKPKKKQDSVELEQAMWMAKRIAFPEYARFMAWEAIDAKDPNNMDELEQRMFLFLDEWDAVGRWRADRQVQMEKDGRKMERVLSRDKTTGAITVNETTLLNQFAGYLGWMAAEQIRKKAERQREALTGEWERVAADGDRGYDDD